MSKIMYMDEEYAVPEPSVQSIKNIWFGVCHTASTTQEKVVTTTSGDFVLATGNMVRVQMDYDQSYNGVATLNVDGTGPVDISCSSATATLVNYQRWKNSEVVDFVYNGSRFVMSSKLGADTTHYGVTLLSSATNSTSELHAATPLAVKAAYDLANGKQDALSSMTASEAQTGTATTARSITAATLKSGVEAHSSKATSTTATLASGSWSTNGTQTVNVTGVTASNVIIVAPATTSMDEYVSCKIKCTGQASGTLTFSCTSVPSSAITVNVLIINE